MKFEMRFVPPDKTPEDKKVHNIIIEDSNKSPRCGADDTHNSMNSKAYELEGLFTHLIWE
jgi:hypothetical protein